MSNRPRLPELGNERILLALLRGDESMTRSIDAHDDAIARLRASIATLDLVRRNAEARLRQLEAAPAPGERGAK